MTDEPRPLTEADRVDAFRRATGNTCGAEDRWAERAARGRTDDELRADLEYEIGWGSSSGGDSPSLDFRSSGLRIWASWIHVCPANHGKPIFQGAATVRMAREVYGIKDPTDTQMGLFEATAP